MKVPGPTWIILVDRAKSRWRFRAKKRWPTWDETSARAEQDISFPDTNTRELLEFEFLPHERIELKLFTSKRGKKTFRSDNCLLFRQIGVFKESRDHCFGKDFKNNILTKRKEKYKKYSEFKK